MERNLILYAEHSSKIRKSFSSCLKELFPEYELELFSDGNSLKSRLMGELEKISLVITDDSMPGEWGLKIVKDCLPDEKYKPIKFILLSTSALSVEEANKNGALGISKFYNRKKTFGMIGDYLNRKK